MAVGYSASPLFRKLGLKKGLHVRFIHAPISYLSEIGEIYDELINHNRSSADLDFIHFFPTSEAELMEILPGLKNEIKKNGMIWISWYKKSSHKTSGISEKMIREYALASGLVDVKVCAIDEDWSGLKLVIRLKER